MKHLLWVICLLFTLNTSAQKWKYDFVVPRDGNFTAAISAANRRADKQKRFRIFIHSSNYRIGATSVQLTAPNTSIVGEEWQNTQVEACMQNPGINATGALVLDHVAGTYLQDLELWANFRNDSKLTRGSCVTLAERQATGTIMMQMHLLGTENTYYKEGGTTTYMEDSRITGTYDFVMGSGSAYFNHCDFRFWARGTSDEHFVIACPSTPAGAHYGFVFNDCYVDGPKHQDKGYYLARAASGAPRCVWLNCQMNIDPSPAGWLVAPGTKPALFAEYESMNRVFEPYDLGQRTGTTQAAITAEGTDDYTVERVFGSDSPRRAAEQVAPPIISIKGREITWEDIPEAGCYAICRNRLVVAFTTQPSYTIPAGTREGTIFSIRCANQMGGLGLRSNDVSYPQR